MKNHILILSVSLVLLGCNEGGGLASNGGGGGSESATSSVAVVQPDPNSTPLEVLPNTVLFLTFESGLTDGTARHVVNADNSADVSTGSKFGIHNRKFSGAQSFEYLNSGDWDFGNGDVAIEFWVKTTQSAMSYIFGQCNATCAVAGHTVSMDLNAVVAGQLRFVINSGGTRRALASTVSVNDGNWHYIKATKVNGTAFLYIDSSLQATSTNILSTPISTNKFVIGKAGEANSAYFDGQIDEFRFNKN